MADVIKIETKDGNIYEVGGKRYRELGRHATTGDALLIIDAEPSGNQYYANGDVFTLEYLDCDRDAYVQEPMEINVIYRYEFVAVEPIESHNEKSIVSEVDQLSRKLTRLEERTNENHRNILMFSQMAESARSDAAKAVGGVNALDEQLDLVREDIVFLEEKIDELKESVEGRVGAPSIIINIENFNVLGTESLKYFIERIAKGCGSDVM